LTAGQPPQLSIVHLAGIGSGLYLTREDEVAPYTDAFAQMSQAALSPAGSAGMLRDMATG
jgi:hypothetical protein